MAVKAGMLAVKYGDDTEKLMPALAMNTMTVLVVDALIMTAFLIEIL